MIKIEAHTIINAILKFAVLADEIRVRLIF